jgi:CBS domain-containing protein
MEIVRTMVLDSSDSLSKALIQLDETPAVIVTKNGGYFGIIDHRCVSHGIRDPHKVRCETVIAKPPVLAEGASVSERIDAFLLGHYKALPVVDSAKKPLGITTRVELLKDMVVESMVPAMNVSELMSSPVFTIDEGETVAAAKNLLRGKNAHRLAVTRMGKLVGVISTFDISAWASKPNLLSGRKDIRLSDSISIDGMKISGFLRPDLTRVKVDASLEETVRRMIDKQASTAIVVGEGKPLGVISALDIFRKVKEGGDEGLQIQVSGLKKDDAAYFARVYAKIGNVLEKFRQSFNIRNTNVHVKSGKATYVVSVYFDTDRGHVSLKAERSTLKEGIDELAVEVHEILRKKKELRRQKPRRTHAH